MLNIIGSGFSSLAASCYLAKSGYEVTIFEKNKTVGGRASQLIKDGFIFDMGPTWYWMPDVFEKFFNDFDKKVEDYYQLIKLNPAYKVFFDETTHVFIEDDLSKIAATFEKLEVGSGQKVIDFIARAKHNYEIAIKDLVYRPGDNILELITPKTIKKVNLFFTSISSEIRSLFKHPHIIQILEFPVLFLGAKPSNTPAFYNFMNYADFGLGTFHPKNGMHSVIKAMESLALELGVRIYTDSCVTSINAKKNQVTSITVNGEEVKTDILLSGADYHFTETLLPQNLRAYSEHYWDKRILAPSALLFYVAFNKKIKNVAHHSLFFDVPFDKHAIEIYDQPQWPNEPLFYASFPSISDDYFAPEGKEAGIFLIPIAPALEDNESIRNLYFDKIISRLEHLTNQELRSDILFTSSFCVADFKEVYNSYKGNAYGLANTLLQTAFLRPKIQSKKVKNLFFTGQLTVPGPGVPPALISGKIASEKIIKQYPL